MNYRAVVIVHSLTHPNSDPIILKNADVQMTYDYVDHIPGNDLVVHELIITPFAQCGVDRDPTCKTCGGTRIRPNKTWEADIAGRQLPCPDCTPGEGCEASVANDEFPQNSSSHDEEAT